MRSAVCGAVSRGSARGSDAAAPSASGCPSTRSQRRASVSARASSLWPPACRCRRLRRARERGCRARGRAPAADAPCSSARTPARRSGSPRPSRSLSTLQSFFSSAPHPPACNSGPILCRIIQSYWSWPSMDRNDCTCLQSSELRLVFAGQWKIPLCSHTVYHHSQHQCFVNLCFCKKSERCRPVLHHSNRSCGSHHAFKFYQDFFFHAIFFWKDPSSSSPAQDQLALCLLRISLRICRAGFSHAGMDVNRICSGIL